MIGELGSARLAIDGLEGGRALRVLGFTGEEGLSELYRFDALAISPVETTSVGADALGSAASLTFRVADRDRVVHGIVASIDSLGVATVGAEVVAQHRIRIVPRAWRMTRRHRSRIFQHKRVDEVIAVVLREAGVPATWQSTQTYPRLEYCTQYEETDFAFVARLLAEYGVYFYFEQMSAEENALDGLAGAAMQVVSGGLDAAGSALTGLAARTGGSEVMVMCDHAAWYPELGRAPTPGLGAIGAGLTLAADLVPGLGEMAGAVQGFASALLSKLGVSPKLRYQPHGGALAHGDTDVVNGFELRSVLSSDEAEYCDYDPSRPNAPLRATRKRRDLDELGADLLSALGPEEALRLAGERALEEGMERGMEALGELGGAAKDLAGSAQPYKLEHYDHHGRLLFPRWEDAKDEATRVLRSVRRNSVVGRGESLCALMTPGRRFALDEHPVYPHNREYVLTGVTHEAAVQNLADPGSSAPTYRNRFQCVPSHVTYVPERPLRRAVQACLTATVVAPREEDIYAEQMARVKVQFHWDREGERNEHSSCWIRAMQSWAGPGWGTQFVPRVGSEVVVGFDGGDPDRPIVFGCLYNAVNPVPFPLPDERTKSGLRTHTTPDGSAGHELSFEDTAGRERVYLHSEKDLEVHAKNDRALRVEHDDKSHVGADHELEVGGSSRTTVAKTHQITAEMGSTRIERDRHAEVRGQDGAHVGSYNLSTEGDAVFRTGGNEVHLIGTRDTPRSLQLQVEGDGHVTAHKTLNLSAEEEVVIRCGASMLRLTPDKAELFAPTVQVQGEDVRALLEGGNMSLYGKGKLTAVFDKVLIRSSGASTSLTSEAAIEGSKVLLNSPGQAEDGMEVETPEPTIIELRDDDGNPLAYQRYRIRQDDGSEITGMLDRDGRAEVPLTSGGQLDFPEVGDAEEA